MASITFVTDTSHKREPSKGNWAPFFYTSRASLRKQDVLWETSPAAKSEEKRLFSGADPGFFSGGGALVSCSTSTPIDHIVFFLQNTSCVRKPQVISGGGVCTPCTLPLNPPLVFELSMRLFYAGAKARVQALELYVKIEGFVWTKKHPLDLS